MRREFFNLRSELVIRASKLVAVTILVTLPRLVEAQLEYAWSYREIFKKADIVVVARPLQTEEAKEHRTLPGDLQFIGMNTQFAAELVLKGKKELNRFVLHYYKRVESEVAILNAPVPLIFDLKEPHSYLMFLIKEPDGRYVAATGPINPAYLSVIELKHGPID